MEPFSKRIKLYLVQPENPSVYSYRRKQFNNFSQITVPYLAAFVDEHRYELMLADEYIEEIGLSICADLVAITVSTVNSSRAYRLADTWRACGIKVAMGGPHATLMPQEAACHCDYLFIGEAEDTWPRFLDDFYHGRAQNVYRSETAPELAGLPKPRWDMLKGRSPLYKGAIFASRGCSSCCSYCNMKQIYHNEYRTRPIPEIVSEIKANPSRFFVFWDDNLFASRPYALELLSALKGIKRKWAAQVTLKSCDDDELLLAAKDAGCLYLFVGLESFNTPSLDDAAKGINKPDEYTRIVKKIHARGLLVQAGLIFGFDSDGSDIFDITLEKCEQAGIDGVTASLLSPFPGTPIYRKLLKEGRLLSGGWDLYDCKTKVAFQPARMSADELYEGYLSFINRFYSLSSFLKRAKISRTNTLVSAFINFGYARGARRLAKMNRKNPGKVSEAMNVRAAVHAAKKTEGNRI